MKHKLTLAVRLFTVPITVGGLMLGGCAPLYQKYMEQHPPLAAVATSAGNNFSSMSTSSSLSFVKNDRGLTAVIDAVYFDFDKSDLRDSAIAEIGGLASTIQQYPNRQVLVEGFTDSIGSANYNQNLSEQRAIAVASTLMAYNVPAARITTRGYGESRPVADNSTDVGRQQNRRVEITILDN